ncbi:Ig-like domain-containing protein [Leptolyngbya sp. GGD]|uniref:Ig-like domain-containing protein n=1 Tax=Leptolyngbya sp. GGD TaxID=2997907 RepID=UPI00227B8D3D|nr:Ig-like domain-containing protein [Leptolyngbya sp. GGD]MCY6494314.1 Ig-like domain-containing protein [Leptolyngbya sp. GGD]
MQLGTSLASATSLTFASGSQAIGDSVSASAPLDQYRFSLNAPSTLRASLNSTSQSVVATITLVHDKNLNQIVDANEVLTSQSTSLVAAELQVQTLDAGTYYLIVSAANPSQSLDYTLQAASTPEVDTDILWRDPVTQELGYWRFDGTTFIGTQRLQYGFSTSWLTGWEIIGIGDFNGDRLDDLAWRSSYSGEVGVWLMGREASGQRLLAGGGVFAGMTVTSDWQLSGIGDLDGDGKADWIWRNPSQGGVGYWLIDGDKVRQTGSFNGTIGAEWVLEGVGDFDGDRKTDLFWRNRNTLQTATWLMNGFTITTGTVLQQQMALNLRVEGFGDFSGDGKTDILLRDTSSGNVSAWLVNNNQIQQSSLLLSNNSIINVPGNWQVVGIDDFTSDRKADIIWRNSTTGEVAIWAIDGLRITQTELLTDPSLRNLNWKVIGTTTRPVMADLPPVETTPPVVQLSLESDTGVLGDRITRLTTIVGRITDQSGLAEVTASLNNLSFINILSWIDANGTIRLDRSRLETILGSVLTDRSYQLVIRAKDRFGNWTNTSSNPLSWTLDTTAPTVSLDLSDSSDTGRSTTDNLTRNRTLQFQGTVGAGAQVQLWLNDLQLNPTITNGTWQITTPTLTGNTYQVKAVATDIAGNTQEVVLSPGLVIDTVAPTAPTGLQIVANSSGAANRRTIAGNAEANTIILLYANGNLVGETLTATDGKWQVETSALPDSDYILIAKAIDAAGNESSLSTSLTFTIASQLSAPGNIRLTSQSDSGLSNADNITKLNKPSVTGTALAGTTVKLYQNNQLLGQAIADSSGTWTITPTTALPSGTHTLRATASSGSLESASTAFNLTIDAVQPAVKLQQFNNGQLATMVDGAILTANSRFVGSIDGTGSNFARLAYQLGNQSEVVINVAEDGLFNQMIDLGSIVPGTTTLQVTATDAAGNEYSKTYAVNISQGAIVAEPPKLIINLIQDTGRSASDGWTTAPGISGFVTQSGFNVLEAQIIQSTSASSTPLFSGFVNISSSFNQNSTFMLDEQQLAGLLNTTTLDDGNYTVQLRAFAGEVKLEQSFFFNLDRTTPVTEVSNLIDGIGWERGTFFEGTIEDLSDNVQFEYWFENAEGVGIGGGGSSLIEGGGFQQTPPEFGIDNEFLEDETAYNLVILSTDLAGNQHRSRFEFFLLGDRTVVDDDTWNKSDPERDNPPPSDPNTPPGNIGPDGELGSRGAFTIGASWTSSEYQSSGWYHRQSDLGGGGTNPPTLIGQGYEYEYRESVYEMTKAAVDRISTHPQTVAKKAALDNRIEILNQIAQRIENLINADGDFKNDRAFINLLAPVMEGLFVDAYDPSAEKAGVWENYVPIGGLWLASDLVKDTRSVRVQVFQATLLSVVTEVLKDRPMVASSPEHQKLVDAVLELGATYAWLNPDDEVNVPVEDQDFAFLNQLWRLQVPNGQGWFADSGTIKQTLQTSVGALGRLLNGVNDPVKAIQFIDHLIQSSSNIIKFKDDLKDGEIAQNLAKLGFEYARWNPTNSGDNVVQSSEFFLRELWQTGDTKAARSKLNEFFSDLETRPIRLQALELASRLLKALKNVPALEPQLQNAEFMRAQFAFVSSFVGSTSPTNSNEHPKHFLSDLWAARTNAEIQSAARKLQTTLVTQKPDILDDRALSTIRVYSSYEMARNALSAPVLANAMGAQGGGGQPTSVQNEVEIPLSSYFKRYEVRYELEADGVSYKIIISDLTTKTEETYRNVVSTPGADFWMLNTPDNRHGQTIIRRGDGSLDIFDANEPVALRRGDSVFVSPISTAEANFLKQELTALRKLGNNLYERWKDVADFISGAVYQYLYDVHPGPWFELMNLIDPLGFSFRDNLVQGVEQGVLPDSIWFKIGRIIGSGAAIIQGIREIQSGTKTITGGGAAVATGGGAVIGTGLVLTGAAQIAHGLGTTVSGTRSLVDNASNVFNQIQSGDAFSITEKPGRGGGDLSAQEKEELTQFNKQIKDFDNKIDQAESVGDIAKANELRYERYLHRKEYEATHGGNGKVLSHEEWLVVKNRLNEASLRGIQDEASVIDDLGLVNNNKLPSERRTTFIKKVKTETGDLISDGATIPDSVTDKAWIDVKSIETSNIRKGVVETLYDSPQFRLQREGARQQGKGSVVIMTGGSQTLLRPSEPLARQSTAVLHFNRTEGKWFGWDRSAGRDGAWRSLKLDEVLGIVGNPIQ